MCFPASALCNRGKALRHQKRNPFYRAPHVSIYIYILYIYKHISTHIISNHIHIFSTYLKVFPIYIYIYPDVVRVFPAFSNSLSICYLHLLPVPGSTRHARPMVTAFEAFQGRASAASALQAAPARWNNVVRLDHEDMKGWIYGQLEPANTTRFI